jgi:hypothetical protein
VVASPRPRHSSGSSWAPIPVDPTRSQNSAVRWRRSPVKVSCGSGTKSARPAESSGAAYCEQNLASGPFSDPHFRHRLPSGAAHWFQRREPAALSVPQ